MLTITSPDSRSRVEVLGGAVLEFTAGVARVDGVLKPHVEDAVKRAGYTIALERPAPVVVETPAPATGPAEQLEPPVLTAGLPPVPPA